MKKIIIAALLIFVAKKSESQLLKFEFTTVKPLLRFEDTTKDRDNVYVSYLFLKSGRGNVYIQDSTGTYYRVIIDTTQSFKKSPNNRFIGYYSGTTTEPYNISAGSRH